MDRRWSVMVLVVTAAVLAWLVGTAVAGDHKRQRRRHGQEHRQEHSEDNAVPAANDPTYQEVCGACHFPLQPALLPARSWQRLLAGSESHFGQSLALQPEQLESLKAYLTANAAERAPGDLAEDIVESLGSSTPLRVTEVSEIRDEHRRLDPSVFERPAVAGRANCPACHQQAAAGIYDDDAVRVPSG